MSMSTLIGMLHNGARNDSVDVRKAGMRYRLARAGPPCKARRSASATFRATSSSGQASVAAHDPPLRASEEICSRFSRHRAMLGCA